MAIACLDLLVENVLDAMEACGIIDICLCPGARNARFVQALSDDRRFCVYSWPEERSAAFYALGLIKSKRAPAAVLTSSGTAAGELLPALMEAHYSGLPLLAVTADRPRCFRGTGAPQCAEQKGLFGFYTDPSLDIALGELCLLEESWHKRGPAHINVCLEDPRGNGIAAPSTAAWQAIPPEHASLHLQTFLAESDHLFVIVGALPFEQRAAVVHFLRALSAPVYLEALSGIREEPSLAHLRIHSVEKLWERAASYEYPIDAVLRLGGIPTLRPWRDLDDSQRHCALLSIDHLPFPGSSRGDFIHVPLGDILATCSISSLGSVPHAFLCADHRAWQQCRSLFTAFPTAEPSLLHALSQLIPSDALVYLGNSLPIREWDMAASHAHPHPHVAANRGLNGIDGQLSTFLGMCTPTRPSWGIFGDLTVLYDLVAPWILHTQCFASTPIFVVINNGGGQIFSRLFKETLFLNQHSYSFASLAQMWHLQYERWYSIPSTLPEYWGSYSTLIEVIPDGNSTARFWEENTLSSL